MKSQHFIRCSAPLCLEANDIDDNSIWYPDEPICSAQPKTGVPNWIKQQRKIARKTVDKDKYFTLRMLKRNCVIGRGIKGIDGDKRNTKWQEKRWLEIHPIKREMTKQEKQKFADRMASLRG